MIFKKGMSFEFADTGPNAGQTGFSPIKQYKLPFKIKKFSGGDVDDIELGDAMRDMPRIRQIHKLGGSRYDLVRLEKRGAAVPNQDVIFRDVRKTLPQPIRSRVAHGSGGLPDARGTSDVDLTYYTRSPHNLLNRLPTGTVVSKKDDERSIYTLPGYGREVNLYATRNKHRALRSVKHRKTHLTLAKKFPHLEPKARRLKAGGMGTEDAWGKVLGIDDPLETMTDTRRTLQLARKNLSKQAAVPNQVFEAGGNKYDVQRLWDVSKKLPRKRLALSDSEDFMESRSWTGGRTPNEILSSRDDSHGHLTRIRKANLRHPVILAPNGGVVDGMHRLAKAKVTGRDTVPVRRFESWGDMKPALLEKRSSEPGHIFVTGYSGAGKSTYAKKLSEETGLPVRGLDTDPRFVRLVHSQKTNPDPRFVEKLREARAAAVRKAVSTSKPHIFEGTQVLVNPGLTSGHRRVLVDLPERRVISQRVGREMSKVPWSTEAELRRDARELIDMYRQEVAAFRKAPEVEIVRPALVKKAYKLQGHKDFQGLPIAIENRKGSVRKGTDSDGNEWRTKMKVPYGYIVGTRGADEEPVDTFVGPHEESRDAFVVHQHKPTGKGYDEDKVMLGFPSKKDAKEMYLAHYDDPKFLGPIHRVSTERLKELVASKKKLVKISQVSYVALLDEILKMAAKEGDLPKGVVAKERVRLVRDAGPAVGALLGAGVGAVRGVRKGRLLPNVVGGLGTGATLGWLPDIVASAGEGAKRYQKKVLAKS